MAPAFFQAVSRLKAERPKLRLLLRVAPTVTERVKAAVAGLDCPIVLIEDEQLKYDAMKAATVALACSGTVTTELALAGCPVVVGYKVGRVTYPILKLMIRTPYITLFNIAAKAFVAPELVQAKCNGPELARAVAQRLDDPVLRERQVAQQFAALEKMGKGGPDPSERAAEVVLGMLDARKRTPV